LSRTLDFDVEEQILTTKLRFVDFAAVCTVGVRRKLGMFQEAVSVDVSLKLLAGDEMVIDTIDFARAGAPGGTADGETDGREIFENAADKDGFSSAGGP
jgi:hypothetical protein